MSTSGPTTHDDKAARDFRLEGESRHASGNLTDYGKRAHMLDFAARWVRVLPIQLSPDLQGLRDESTLLWVAPASDTG